MPKPSDSGEFVGNLWAEREKEREREGEGEDQEEGGWVLWALGGNLCLAFEGWGSYNYPFVTSWKR